MLSDEVLNEWPFAALQDVCAAPIISILKLGLYAVLTAVR